MTVILEPSDDNIQRAARALLSSRVVAIPTETVYGLAGNAFDEIALATIFTVKERPTFDPHIVHIPPLTADADVVLANLGLLARDKLTPAERERLLELTGAFWPGPLTIVMPRGPQVPDLVTSGLATVAVRCPGHPVTQRLLHATACPLAAPSANRFGRISPTTAAHVLEELGGRIDFILDGGQSRIGIESTVVTITDPPTVLRPGSVTQEALTRTVGVTFSHAKPNAALADAHASPYGPALASPGMLERHYAPGKHFVRLPVPVSALTDEHIHALRALVDEAQGPVALISVFGDPRAQATRLREITGRDVLAHTLSAVGDPTEAASNLFRTLRLLDSTGAALLVAEPVNDGNGLLHAIADRLNRATTPL